MKERLPRSVTQLEAENEVNNEMANRMSLFYAEATPMLKTLSNATTKFVSEVRPVRPVPVSVFRSEVKYNSYTHPGAKATVKLKLCIFERFPSTWPTKHQGKLFLTEALVLEMC